MKETEFKALISLLDDNDPNVESHVRQTLVGLGDEAISRLEEAWEKTDDELVQNRIEDIIHIIQMRGTLEGIRAWKRNGGNSLLRGWYLVTQLHYPELDFETYYKKLSRLGHRAWLYFRRDMNILQKLVELKRLMFRDEGYRLNEGNMRDPSNFYLNRLMDSRLGNPTSLCALFLLICEDLELPVNGVILPGYFVLLYKDKSNEIYLDLFNQKTFFSRKDLTFFLKEMKVEQKEKYYQARSNTEIIRLLIKHLIAGYEQEKNYEKVRELTILLQELDGDSTA